MKRVAVAFIMVWISGGLLSGCASSKSAVFGEEMPTMKEIHDEKFSGEDKVLNSSPRLISDEDEPPENSSDFQWLPNPILNMHVFKHLSPAGYPVPGYNTFFRMYDKEQLAIPGEEVNWDQ